jgi:hypothetical protein
MAAVRSKMERFDEVTRTPRRWDHARQLPAVIRADGELSRQSLKRTRMRTAFALIDDVVIARKQRGAFEAVASKP